MNVFRKKFGKLYELECSETEEKFSGDKEVILEVIENLLSNAFRYAKTKVEMEVFLTCSELQIRIKDDGVGFTIDKLKGNRTFLSAKCERQFETFRNGHVYQQIVL